MKTLFKFLLLLLVVVFGWPYVTLWQLDHAIKNDHDDAIAWYAHFGYIQQAVAARSDAQINIPGNQHGPILSWVQQGITAVNQVGAVATVNPTWMKTHLRGKPNDQAGNGYLGRITYAFYQNLETFIVKVGDDAHNRWYLKFRFSPYGWRMVEMRPDIS